MTILDKILKGIDRCRRETGKDPEAIYVGNENFYKLMETPEYTRYLPPVHLSEPEVLGVKVLVVNRDNYLRLV